MAVREIKGCRRSRTCRSNRTTCRSAQSARVSCRSSTGVAASARRGLRANPLHIVIIVQAGCVPSVCSRTVLDIVSLEASQIQPVADRRGRALNFLPACDGRQRHDRDHRSSQSPCLAMATTAVIRRRTESARIARRQ